MQKKLTSLAIAGLMAAAAFQTPAYSQRQLNMPTPGAFGQPKRKKDTKTTKNVRAKMAQASKRRNRK